MRYCEKCDGEGVIHYTEGYRQYGPGRDRLDLTAQARRLYRLVPDAAVDLSKDDIDDLLADLAGCEVRIEELERDLSDAQEFIERLQGKQGPTFITTSSYAENAAVGELEEIGDMLDSAGADPGPSTINRVEDLLVSLQLCITIDDHREALEVKDRDIQTLRDERRELKASLADAMANAEKWKDKAHREASARWRAECERDECLERLEDAQAQHIGRRIARQVIRRAMEVVR